MEPNLNAAREGEKRFMENLKHQWRSVDFIRQVNEQWGKDMMKNAVLGS